MRISTPRVARAGHPDTLSRSFAERAGRQAAASGADHFIDIDARIGQHSAQVQAVHEMRR